jgi:hypothetical protein
MSATATLVTLKLKMPTTVEDIGVTKVAEISVPLA